MQNHADKPKQSERRGVASALDVVRRAVSFAARDERSAAATRFLGATCLPWVERALQEDVLEAEQAVLLQLREGLSGWDESLDPATRWQLATSLMKSLDQLGSLIGERGGPPPEAPMAEIVPPPPVQATNDGAGGATSSSGKAEATDAQAADAVRPPQGDGQAAEEPRRRSRRKRGRKKQKGSAEPPARAEGPAPEGQEAPEKEEAARQPEPVTEPGFTLWDPKGPGAPLRESLPVPDAVAGPLDEAGVRTVADLLLLRPVRYDLLPRAVSPSEAQGDGQAHVVRGEVWRRVTRMGPFGRVLEVVLTDGQARVICRWAGEPSEGLLEHLEPGARVSVFGTLDVDDDQHVVLRGGEPVWVDSRGQGRQACYDLSVPDREIRSLLRIALARYGSTLRDPLPDAIRRRIRLLPLGDALWRLHLGSHRRGQERLAFDELLLYQLGRGLARHRLSAERGIPHKISHKLLCQAMQQHSLALNDHQEAVLSEIRRDLHRPTPMNRLLQGEVGTGKGLLALLATIMVAEGKTQVVVVAPDPMAAEHRFLFAEPILKSVGLAPTLMVDRPDSAQQEVLRKGETQVVFATPAFVRPWPGMKKLGLVVVEERGQHGAIGLHDLPVHGARPDLMVLSDAPIPSSIALTVFGDMALSSLPGGLNPSLRVEVFQAGQREDAYALARQELEAGRQAYVVLPMVNGEEPLAQRDLARVAEALRTQAFPQARIGLFTGLMSREERQRVHDDFRHRRVDVLLTTTIIEDSPVVQAATAMVVEQADRFDLVRLHRLRALVGKGNRPGRCLLILGDKPDDRGRKAVELVEHERDGFRLAELDLAWRGAEALLGERSREQPPFRWVDPLDHHGLLVQARSEAFRMLEDGRLLKGPEFSTLREEVEERWRAWFPGKPLLGRKGQPGQRSGRRRRRKS